MEEYKGRATFVHLYGPEPHPVAPGTNFDHGVQVNSYWSTVRQPVTYQDRLDMVGRVRDWLHPDEVCPAVVFACKASQGRDMAMS